MNTYYNNLVSLGFLPEFLELYFRKMLELGFSENLSYEFFINTYKENTKNGNITNIFDVIEKAKKSKVLF